MRTKLIGVSLDADKELHITAPPLAESITGHGRDTSEFANYGSVGYTLEQKRHVIKQILV